MPKDERPGSRCRRHSLPRQQLRRSVDLGRAREPLHLVSASEQGLALGQREVDGKSNEITAIPALLETLSLTNSIVTLDAMGCQKTIAGRILERGADYLLGLKANHGRQSVGEVSPTASKIPQRRALG
jgi:hypothetical protein